MKIINSGIKITFLIVFCYSIINIIHPTRLYMSVPHQMISSISLATQISSLEPTENHLCIDKQTFTLLLEMYILIAHKIKIYTKKELKKLKNH